MSGGPITAQHARWRLAQFGLEVLAEYLAHPGQDLELHTVRGALLTTQVMEQVPRMCPCRDDCTCVEEFEAEAGTLVPCDQVRPEILRLLDLRRGNEECTTDEK